MQPGDLVLVNSTCPTFAGRPGMVVSVDRDGNFVKVWIAEPALETFHVSEIEQRPPTAGSEWQLATWAAIRGLLCRN